MRTRLTIMLALTALLAWPAAAQERQPLQINSYGAVLDNIDLLIDHYSNFLARKYELTDEQDQYTRHLLRERSHEFLDSHQDDLRGLIETLFEVRTGGEMSAEGLMEWGEAARPIYEDARKLIVAGNDDWREILSEDQKRRHDDDLKLMYESFETTETQLDRIATGEMTVDEFRNPRRSRAVTRRTARATPDEDAPPPPDIDPPSNRMDPPSDEAASAARQRAEELRERLAERRRQRAEGQPEAEDSPMIDPGSANSKAARRRPVEEAERPERTAEPRRGSTKPPESSSRRETTRRTTSKAPAGKDHASAWEKYVEDFIARYALDDAQQQQARSILEDCKQRADQYLQSKKSTMERIDEDLTKLKATREGDSKRRASQISKLTEQQTKLKAPIDDIFEKQLKPRLERIPTRSQVRAAEESKNKKGKKGGRD